MFANTKKNPSITLAKNTKKRPKKSKRIKNPINLYRKINNFESKRCYKIDI